MKRSARDTTLFPRFEISYHLPVNLRPRGPSIMDAQEDFPVTNGRAAADGFFDRALLSGVASFDVFDTAIWRRTAQPTHVFAIVEKKLASIRSAAAADGYAEARVSAERFARELGRQEWGEVETTLDAIYAALPKFWKRDVDIIQQVRSYEVAVERELAAAEPAIHAIYSRLKEAGVKTIFVSDNYLNEMEVRDLLERCGYDAVDPVFVSSECSLAKWNGSIWPFVSKSIGVTCDSIVHIGDNFKVDVEVARARGLVAFHWPGRSRDHKPAAPVSRWIVPLTILKSATQGIDSSEEEAAVWSRLGRAYGPLIYGPFLRWIWDQVQNGVDHIYFCAREGEILQRLWSELIDPHASGPSISYLQVSRRTLNLPWMSRIDAQAIEFLVSGKEPLPVSTIIDRAGLSDAPSLVNRALNCFGSLDAVIESAEDRDKLREFFRTCEAELAEAAQHHRDLAGRYLEQENLFAGGRRVIVDLGWRGSLQRSLSEFIRLRDAPTLLSGLYLGLTHEAAVNRGSAGWMAAMTVNDFMSKQSDFQLRQMVTLLEQLFAAKHGTVSAYLQKEGKFVPVYSDSAVERCEYERKIFHFQEAACSELSLIFRGRHVIKPDQLTPLGAWAALIDLCLYPSADEARTIGDMLYLDGFEHAGAGVPLSARLSTPSLETARTILLKSHTWVPGALRNWRREYPEISVALQDLAREINPDKHWVSQFA